MGMPQPIADWTVERVLALPDDGNRYEAVDGASDRRCALVAGGHRARQAHPGPARSVRDPAGRGSPPPELAGSPGAAWIVDLDARLVERWRPSDERPEILAERLEWQPATGVPPLPIDLPHLFAEILDE